MSLGTPDPHESNSAENNDDAVIAPLIPVGDWSLSPPTPELI